MALQLFIGIEVLTRRIEIAVSHQPLHGHDVATALQQSRGVGVPELMERRIPNASDFRDLF